MKENSWTKTIWTCLNSTIQKFHQPKLLVIWWSKRRLAGFVVSTAFSRSAIAQFSKLHRSACRCAARRGTCEGRWRDFDQSFKAAEALSDQQNIKGWEIEAKYLQSLAVINVVVAIGCYWAFCWNKGMDHLWLSTSRAASRACGHTSMVSI